MTLFCMLVTHMYILLHNFMNIICTESPVIKLFTTLKFSTIHDLLCQETQQNTVMAQSMHNVVHTRLLLLGPGKNICQFSTASL